MNTMDGHTPSSSTATTNPTFLSRDQIMDVTGRCLREVGYDATTIRKIASTLDCAVGSIYRYFRDKRDLLFAVTQQVLQPVVDHIEAGGAFEQNFAMYLQRASADPECYRLMFWLACVENDKQAVRTGPTSATDENIYLPPIVRRILEVWARRLGDAALARKCWAVMHGSLMLGEDITVTRETLRTIVEREPAGGTVAVAPPAKASQLTPLPQRNAPARHDGQPLPADDVEVEADAERVANDVYML